MPTVTAENAFKDVRSHAESIKNDAPQRIEVMSENDAWAQGDILLTCLSGLPQGCKRIDKPETQLAPGTTQGSRHCLDSLSDIEMFSLTNATPLDGPVIKSDRQFTVEHPEHGNITLPPGVYGVTYQRAFAAELRRTQD